jgi:hypothetical protein
MERREAATAATTGIVKCLQIMVLYPTDPRPEPKQTAETNRSSL